MVELQVCAWLANFAHYGIAPLLVEISLFSNSCAFLILLLKKEVMFEKVSF